MEFAVTALTLPLTALTTGFLGSLHCLGMCGGVSGTIALGASALSPRGGDSASMSVTFPVTFVRRGPQSLSTPQTNVLAFNAGRIGSYMIAGAMAGSIGGAIGQGWVMSDTMTARTLLFLFANMMIIATGLTLMGIPQLLAPLERLGGVLWPYVSPLTKKILPLNTLPRAALFGMLWGWIPCGMVYAILLSAMSAGSAAAGMLTMLGFGLGTLPAMLAAGWAAGGLGRWARDWRLRLAAGAAVVAMGVFGFARADSLRLLQNVGALCIAVVQPAASSASILP